MTYTPLSKISMKRKAVSGIEAKAENSGIDGIFHQNNRFPMEQTPAVPPKRVA
jgi:hypothetical protein